MSKKKNPEDYASSSSEIINKVMHHLGRSHTDGAVKGDNLSKIITYLYQTKSEDYDKTVSRLSLRVGMMNRYIKENYLYGLEAESIIHVFMSGNTKRWEWVGVKE